MKRTWIIIALLTGVVGVVVLWLICGRTVVLSLDGRELSRVVDLACFGNLRPDMRRSEIKAIMGEPERVHVTDIEYGKDGEVEYQEIRWAYAADAGIVAYYVEEYNIPGGSVEYVPEKMRLAEFFRIPLHIGFGKRFIEVRNSGRCLLVVRLRDGDTIERINWYWTK